MISEKIYINNELVLDYKVGNTLMLTLKGTEQLNKTINPSQNLSAVKYVYSNTSLTSNLDKRNLNNRMFLAFFEQIKAMLLFRNVFDGIHYIGQHNGGINIVETEGVVTGVTLLSLLLAYILSTILLILKYNKQK